MDMQASKEFLAELKVLTHVHHLNLGGTPCNGLQGCKLPLIQREDLNTFMNILFLSISIVISNQQIY
ncbi:Chitin elicitor receptor kinase 1 [Camellia lanceoleosa]|uniref:Chitin elicitor receptor kinase 1 n=1 Tax=Camellia lanceoleosa TaxID=1840588 RepID=A0ACC0HJY4_9ERIC|nr:Chitin elicitor receptor kinase 1 [Camellia lanceoleosa]